MSLMTLLGFPETGGITRVKLRFVDVDRPENPLFTGCPVKWQYGENPKVAIFENDTQIMQGDLSKLQIEILAVNADFFTEQGQEDFTKEQFNRQIYLCKGKYSVLTTVNLANGKAYIGSIFFTESSQRRRLRLTARVKKRILRSEFKKQSLILLLSKSAEIKQIKRVILHLKKRQYIVWRELLQMENIAST